MEKVVMTIIYEFILVGIGGALGAMCRFVASKFASTIGFAPLGPLPVATMCVNVLGCFLAGFVFSMLSRGGALAEEVRLLCIVGFLGGFTTFSAFSLETLLVMREAGGWSCILFVSATVMSALLAAAAGRLVAGYF